MRTKKADSVLSTSAVVKDRGYYRGILKEMAPTKQRFRVVSVSGEDPDFPARELQHHTPETRGWQCPRYEICFACKYMRHICIICVYKMTTNVLILHIPNPGLRTFHKRSLLLWMSLCSSSKYKFFRTSIR